MKEKIKNASCKTVKIRVIILVGLILIISHSFACADGGYISYIDTVVYEPSQSAIIGWNGTREVFLLSTNVRANSENWAIELIPFPSLPAEPVAGTLDIFQVFKEYIDAAIGTPMAGDVDLNKQIDILDALLVAQFYVGLKPSGFYKYAGDVDSSGEINIVDALILAQYYVGLNGGSWSKPSEVVNVVFQEQIGIHNVTTVETENASELILFAEQVLSEVAATDDIKWTDFENIATDYITRGMKYWVIDLLDLTESTNSRDPLIYSFETDYLYFPLIVSSVNSGSTLIDVVTVSKTKLNREGIESAGFEGTPIDRYFDISLPDLMTMSPEIADLFAAISYPLKIARHYYKGPLSNLNKDIITRERE
jgi:hypothetical protein